MRLSSAPVLETDRLRLRPYELADFEDFANLLGSPRSQYMDGPVDRSAAWKRFEAGIGCWALVSYGPWIIERKEDKVSVGLVSLNYLMSPREKELGWALWEGCSGQGFALEAARRARAFAFETLGWSDMVSYVAAANGASIRLAERLGAKLDKNATATQEDDTLVYRHRRNSLRA